MVNKAALFRVYHRALRNRKSADKSNRTAATAEISRKIPRCIIFALHTAYTGIIDYTSPSFTSVDKRTPNLVWTLDHIDGYFLKSNPITQHSESSAWTAKKKVSPKRPSKMSIYRITLTIDHQHPALEHDKAAHKNINKIDSTKKSEPTLSFFAMR